MHKYFTLIRFFDSKLDEKIISKLLKDIKMTLEPIINYKMWLI